MACSENSTSIFAKTPDKETNTMSSAQAPGYHETPAMAQLMAHNVMPHNVLAHTALPGGNDHQADRGEHDGRDRVLDMALGERSAAEQCARATQRLATLGEMTGGIVHDFRNLLAGIESGLRLTEKSSELPEKVRVYIAAAREGIDRGVKLASQLLAFATQQELEAHAGDVNELLKNLELFLRYGAGPGIRVVLELTSDIPKCLIDPSQFDAAVINLVINARDAMPNGGEIQISTERWAVKTAVSGAPAPGTYVRVRVKDSGQGMSAEVARKVFDPFFTTKGEKGTGLGLPQVYAFMRLVGGYVGVTSEQGIGTNFDLLFPSAEPDGIVALHPLRVDFVHELVLGQ
jgi:signal transduction histidine kinase